MIRCNECGEIFEDEQMLELKEPTGEILGHCLFCKSDDLDDVYMCPTCGENYVDAKEDSCDHCKEEMQELLSEVLEDFMGARDCTWEKAMELLISTVEEMEE